MEDREHIIVTGASGFIGAACVREFLDRGWSVSAVVHRRTRRRKGQRALDRLSEFRGRVGLTVAATAIDVREDLERTLSEQVGVAGGRCRALIHCAGRVSDVGWDRLFRSSNLVGVENICRAVERLGIGRLIHMSTTDVYGVRNFVDADERTPLQDNRRNPYARYKILAEEHIRRALPRDRFVILRPALVWGPGDTTVLPRAIAFLRASPAIVYFGGFRGRNIWPLAYVRNVVRVAYASAVDDAALGEAYNIVDPERTTMDGYYQMLLEHHLPGRRLRTRVTVPVPLAWPAAALSTALSTLLARDQPVFDPSLYALFHVSHSQDFSGAKAEALLRRCGLDFVDRRSALEEVGL